MKGKKLFTLLRALDAGEFKQLKRAACSPLLNTNERVVGLYDYLQPFYPGFEGPELEDKALYGHLFPGESYDDYKLRRLLSGMSRLVERYMAYLEASPDEKEEQLMLARAFGRRNLFSLFEKKSKEILAVLEHSPFRDLEYYRQKIEIFTNYYFHPFTDKRAIGQERLQELVHDLDYRYALEMYRVGNELRNRERILSEHYQLVGIDAMEDQYGEGVLSRNAIFRTYRSLLKAYKDEEDTGLYLEVKDSFMAHFDEMRRDDKVLLFQQLLNYTIRRINRGDSAFYKESLALYKMGLKAGLLTDGGRMSAATYSNIVLVSCEEGQFIWAQAFMGQYENHLDDEARKDTRAHCYSLWYYFQGQFDEAQQILASHHFSRPFQPSSRMTSLRITFEQFFQDNSYYGLLLSQAEAFEKFLKRDKALSADRKQSHRNTISLIKRVASALARRDPLEEVRQWAMEEIGSGQPLVLRQWLRQKVAQLPLLPF